MSGPGSSELDTATLVETYYRHCKELHVRRPNRHVASWLVTQPRCQRTLHDEETQTPEASPHSRRSRVTRASSDATHHKEMDNLLEATSSVVLSTAPNEQRHFDTTTRLDLSTCYLGPRGVVALVRTLCHLFERDAATPPHPKDAEGMVTSRPTRTMDRVPEPTPIGCPIRIGWVVSFAAITHLNLDHQCLYTAHTKRSPTSMNGNEVLQNIVHALTPHPTLEHLSLQYNEIAAVGYRLLLRLAFLSPSLREIRVEEGNYLRNEYLEILLWSLQHKENVPPWIRPKPKTEEVVARRGAADTTRPRYSGPGYPSSKSKELTKEEECLAERSPECCGHRDDSSAQRMQGYGDEDSAPPPSKSTRSLLAQLYVDQKLWVQWLQSTHGVGFRHARLLLDAIYGHPWLRHILVHDVDLIGLFREVKYIRLDANEVLIEMGDRIHPSDRFAYLSARGEVEVRTSDNSVTNFSAPLLFGELALLSARVNESRAATCRAGPGGADIFSIPDQVYRKIIAPGQILRRRRCEMYLVDSFPVFRSIPRYARMCMCDVLEEIVLFSANTDKSEGEPYPDPEDCGELRLRKLDNYEVLIVVLEGSITLMRRSETKTAFQDTLLQPDHCDSKSCTQEDSTGLSPCESSCGYVSLLRGDVCLIRIRERDEENTIFPRARTGSDSSRRDDPGRDTNGNRSRLFAGGSTALAQVHPLLAQVLPKLCRVLV